MDITPAQQEATIEYVPEATIVINASGSYYGDVVPVPVKANQISQKYRDYEAIVGREASKIAALDKVQAYLIENYEELELHADSIASLLGIELTRTVTVQATVTFELELTLGAGQTIEDVMDDISYDASLYYNNDATLESVNVCDQSWDED